jgi:CheY-like chemotaxis protein
MISSSDILNAKVLIVDNEEVSVLLLERLLRGAGYVSITSTTDPGEVCALHRSDIKTLTSPGLINRAGQSSKLFPTDVTEVCVANSENFP